MDTISLKKYIFENEKIEFILNEIGCKDIVYHSNKEFFSCSNYNGDNKSAVNVKNNEYLNVTNWTRKEFDDNSDIITLVEYNKQLSFIEAIKYLHTMLGLEYKWQKKPEKQKKISDPVDILAKHRCKKKVDVDDIHVLDEDLLNDYVPLLYIGWLKEGIMPWTAKKFGLAYSYKYKRVVVPMRYWLTGELLGVNMRTTVENYKELGIKKYFLTPSYQKNLNLYGLYENCDSITSKKIVTIFEAEKSVLKRDSLGDSTCVALSGHTLSDEQARILIGLNTNEIVIALDKDVDIDEVRFMCEKFYRVRNVSYIYDKWDLLNKKDSPADANNKIYNFLFKYRIKYDESEHKQYLKSLERK